VCARTQKECISARTYHCKPSSGFHTVRDSDDGYGGSELGYAQCSAATGGERDDGLGLGDLCYLQHGEVQRKQRTERVVKKKEQ
jgi:hypothetical protein